MTILFVRKWKNLLRSVISPVTNSTIGIRCLSTNSENSSHTRKLTIFNIDNRTGIASLSMNNPPVNSMNIELLTELKLNLKEAEKIKVRGLILTSSLEKVFSAGFDLVLFHTNNREFLTELISLGQDVHEVVHSFPFPTAALINGHALGAGCGIASCCEYRTMMPNNRIGIIGVAVGLVMQEWIQKLMLELLDKRTTELAFTQAKQFRTEEALQIGLVDKIACNKAEGLVECEKFINSFSGINPVARAATKRLFRYKLFSDKQAEAKEFVDELLQPCVQNTIGEYLNALKLKRKT